METKKAKIKREEEEKATLILELDENLEIVITEDNPNSIKTAFNKLIIELKKGLFQFELEDDKDDLYNNICTEYLNQLNSEMRSVFEELEDYELLDLQEDSPEDEAEVAQEVEEEVEENDDDENYNDLL